METGTDENVPPTGKETSASSGFMSPLGFLSGVRAMLSPSVKVSTPTPVLPPTSTPQSPTASPRSALKDINTLKLLTPRDIMNMSGAGVEGTQPQGTDVESNLKAPAHQLTPDIAKKSSAPSEKLERVSLASVSASESSYVSATSIDNTLGSLPDLLQSEAVHKHSGAESDTDTSTAYESAGENEGSVSVLEDPFASFTGNFLNNPSAFSSPIYRTSALDETVVLDSSADSAKTPNAVVSQDSIRDGEEVNLNVSDLAFHLKTLCLETPAKTEKPTHLKTNKTRLVIDSDVSGDIVDSDISVELDSNPPTKEEVQCFLENYIASNDDCSSSNLEEYLGRVSLDALDQAKAVLIEENVRENTLNKTLTVEVETSNKLTDNTELLKGTDVSAGDQLNKTVDVSAGDQLNKTVDVSAGDQLNKTVDVSADDQLDKTVHLSVEEDNSFNVLAEEQIKESLKKTFDAPAVKENLNKNFEASAKEPLNQSLHLHTEEPLPKLGAEEPLRQPVDPSPEGSVSEPVDAPEEEPQSKAVDAEEPQSKPIDSPAEETVSETVSEPVDAPAEGTVSETVDARPQETVNEPVDVPPEETLSEPVDAPAKETLSEPVGAPVEETLSEPVGAPAEETVSEPVDVPPQETLSEPVDAPPQETVSEPVDVPPQETVSEPVDVPPQETVSEPVDAPAEESVSEPVGGAAEETLSEPVGAPAEETVSVHVGGPAEETVSEPVDLPTEETVSEPVGAPAEGTVSEPVDAPAEGTVSEPVDAPALEPLSEPTDVLAEETLSEPVDAPAEGTVSEPVDAPAVEPWYEPTDTLAEVPLPAVLPRDESLNNILNSTYDTTATELKLLDSLSRTADVSVFSSTSDVTATELHLLENLDSSSCVNSSLSTSDEISGFNITVLHVESPVTTNLGELHAQASNNPPDCIGSSKSFSLETSDQAVGELQNIEVSNRSVATELGEAPISVNSHPTSVESEENYLSSKSPSDKWNGIQHAEQLSPKQGSASNKADKSLMHSIQPFDEAPLPVKASRTFEEILAAQLAAEKNAEDAIPVFGQNKFSEDTPISAVKAVLNFDDLPISAKPSIPFEILASQTTTLESECEPHIEESSPKSEPSSKQHDGLNTLIEVCKRQEEDLECADVSHSEFDQLAVEASRLSLNCLNISRGSEKKEEDIDSSFSPSSMNQTVAMADRDDNFNPFMTKAKVAASPPPQRRNNMEDITYSPFATKSKITASPSPHGENNLDDGTGSPFATKFKVAPPPQTSRQISTEVTNGSSSVADLQAANSLVAGPQETDINDTANHFKTSAETCFESFDNNDLFRDPTSFDFLSRIGSGTSSRDLRKESLYVKFDPLVGSVISNTTVGLPLPRMQPTHPDSSLREEETTESTAPNEMLQTLDKGVPESPVRTVPKTPLRNPALANVGKLISLSPAATTRQDNISSGSTPSSPAKVMSTNSTPAKSPAHFMLNETLQGVGSRGTVISQEDLIRRLQEHQIALAEQDQAYQERIAELEQMVRESEERELNKNKQLQDSEQQKQNLTMQLQESEQQKQKMSKQLQDSEQQKQHLNKQLQDEAESQVQLSTIVKEYERTISGLVAEKEEIIKERDVAQKHLNNIELAFSDLHTKYERAKSAVEGFRKNEEVLNAALAERSATLEKVENLYEKLKSHAVARLDKSNQDLEIIKQKHHQEVAKLKAMVKKLEVKTKSLEETLQQKVTENQALTAICDELINKVDPQ